MAMTEEVAREKIAKFLRPIAREWMWAKREEKDEDGELKPTPHIGMCEACYEFTLGNKDFCSKCEKMKAEDPKKFAEMNYKCDKCFADMDYHGCSAGCDEEREDYSKKSCRVCGAPCDDDWGWTGHCSRWCATSYDRGRRADRW